MRTWVGRLIEVHDSILKILLERPFQRDRASRNGSIVFGEDIHLMIVFQKERPVARVELALVSIGRNNVLLFLLLLRLHFNQLFLRFLLFAHLINKIDYC